MGGDETQLPRVLKFKFWVPGGTHISGPVDPNIKKLSYTQPFCLSCAFAGAHISPGSVVVDKPAVNRTVTEGVTGVPWGAPVIAHSVPTTRETCEVVGAGVLKKKSTSDAAGAGAAPGC